MPSYDFVICGAGITGLAIAREIIAQDLGDVLVFDKEPEPGRHASGRNSGVLHAGIYYAPGSMRAACCIEGNLSMRRYCEERGLPMIKTGKVIVARDPSELPALNELHRRATANGADTRIIGVDELADIEPLAKTTGKALLSPNTAVVNPKAILKSLVKELEDSGRVRLLMNAPFKGRKGPRTVLAGGESVGYKKLFINAAGAYADRVAGAFGLGKRYALIPFKGIYKKVKPPRADMIRGSIYPVPNIRNPFLGVHFTRGASNDVYVGPTAIPALGRENYGYLDNLGAETIEILARDLELFLANPKFRGVALTEPRKYFFKHFFEDARKLVKELDPQDLAPTGKCGIRPQLVDLATRELAMDFVIERDQNSLHVLNAISPAFTSSLYFAARVVGEHITNKPPACAC